MKNHRICSLNVLREPVGAAETAPYFSVLLGCLSFFSFRSFACLVAFCFWPLSLSFLPPLSPMYASLWYCAGHIPAVRGPVFLTMNVTKSMRRRQEREWRPSAASRKWVGFKQKGECEIACNERRNLREGVARLHPFFAKKR